MALDSCTRKIIYLVIALIILLILVNWYMNSRKPTVNQYQFFDQMAGQATQGDWPYYGVHADHSHGQHSHPSDHPSDHPSSPGHFGPITPIPPAHTPSPAGHNTFTLYYFYQHGCPACDMFDPVWTDLTSTLQNNIGLELRPVDVKDPANHDLSFYFNIKRTPTLIMATPDKYVEYHGRRTRDRIAKFVNDEIANYTRSLISNH